MKKKLLTSILASVMSLCLTFGAAVPACAAAAQPAEGQLKIMSLSDTHLMASSLIADTDDYDKALNSERKMYAESESILNAELANVRKQAPDVLIITGDLTKDGELENHKLLASKLRALKKDMPKLKVYVINGNHDINNAEGKLFNTKSGKAIAATRTSPKAFINNYKDITYGDPTVIARYTPPAGKQAGQLSYAARPQKGYTIIAIDSGCYSSDNTTSGKNEHETNGAVSKDLQNWVVKQIKAAKKRGDTVIGMEHHNMVPHLTMEQEILPMYLVDRYEELSTAYADAGMHYFFSGHMHAQDVAKMTTEKGNAFYDIETGSAVTYPCPARVTTFSRKKDGSKIKETAAGLTIENLAVTYKNPLTGKTQQISDLTVYAQKRGLSVKMLTTTVTGFIETYTDKANLIYSKPALEKVLGKVMRDASSIPVTADGKHDLLQFANLTYQIHLSGTEYKAKPDWFKEARKNIKNGTVRTRLMAVLAADLAGIQSSVTNAIYGYINSKLPAGITIADASKADAAGKAIDDYLVQIVDSFSIDKNFPSDNIFTVRG